MFDPWVSESILYSLFVMDTDRKFSQNYNQPFIKTICTWKQCSHCSSLDNDISDWFESYTTNKSLTSHLHLKIPV